MKLPQAYRPGWSVARGLTQVRAAAAVAAHCCHSLALDLCKLRACEDGVALLTLSLEAEPGCVVLQNRVILPCSASDIVLQEARVPGSSGWQTG